MKPITMPTGDAQVILEFNGHFEDDMLRFLLSRPQFEIPS